METNKPTRPFGRGFTTHTVGSHLIALEEQFLASLSNIKIEKPKMNESEKLTATESVDGYVPTQPESTSLTKPGRGANPNYFQCDEFGDSPSYDDKDYHGYSTEKAPVVPSPVVEMMGGIITTVPEGCKVMGKRYRLVPMDRESNWYQKVKLHRAGMLIAAVNSDTYRVATLEDVNEPSVYLYTKEDY